MKVFPAICPFCAHVNNLSYSQYLPSRDSGRDIQCVACGGWMTFSTKSRVAGFAAGVFCFAVFALAFRLLAAEISPRFPAYFVGWRLYLVIAIFLLPAWPLLNFVIANAMFRVNSLKPLDRGHGQP